MSARVRRRSGSRKHTLSYAQRAPASKDHQASPAPAADKTTAGLTKRIGNSAALRLNSGPQQNVQARMSNLFGVPLHDVKLRTDSEAAEKSSRAGAHAYSEGREIGFAPNAYAPGTRDGEQRLVHEFAHVVQRSGGNRRDGVSVANEAAAELQARQAGEAAVGGARPAVTGFASSGRLFDKPGGNTHVFTIGEIQGWVTGNKDIYYQVFRVHMLRVYPAATTKDILDAMPPPENRVLTFNAAAAVKHAREKHKTTIAIPIFAPLDKHIRDWLAKEKKIQTGPGKDAGEGSADGSDKGKGTGDNGDGGGSGGKGQGSGSTNAVPKLGISSDPGTKVKAKSAADAGEQLQAELDQANQKADQVEAEDSDHKKRFWPEEFADPKERQLIVDVMKEIVGEVKDLPKGEDSKLPVSIRLDEATFLLKIATSDKDTRDAIVAKLKGNGELHPDNGQTLSQKLETVIENVEIDQHADELGVTVNKGPPSTDPSKTPIENRPVRGGIVNLIGALSIGERSVWKLRVDDDRDAFRVPFIYVSWLAVRLDKDTKATAETVSSENSKYIPIDSQGILNDSEFDFTVRSAGPHMVKAIVQHNFFRPAYFEEPFLVEEEFPQGDRQFNENNKGLVDKADSWNEEFYDHGGSFDYRLGRMRRGKLDPKAQPTTDQDLIDSLEQQKKLVKDNVELLAKQDESRREDLEKARDERLAELDKQIATLTSAKVTDAKALVAHGQFSSRVRDVDDAEMKLSCSVKEVAVTDSESGSKRTEFLITLHDATARGSRQVYHWSQQAQSVQAAQRLLFLDVAEAYPFGTVTVLFQGYNHTTHQATPDFVQFQKRTDTVSKDVKSVVYDDTVDTLVNVVGTVLSIIPVTAPIGITLLVVYNGSKALSDNLDDAETNNFEHKKAYLALGDLVLNLLPLAPKVVKVGKAAYWVIKVGSIAGGVVLMGAVGLQQVRDLRTNYVDVLVRKKQRLEDLKKNNKAHPELVSGSLQREIDELTKKTSETTQQVFTTIAAQAVFMHVVSTAIDVGTTGAKSGPGPVETRVLPDLEGRKKAISGLSEQGGFVHEEGAKPRYDYDAQKVVGDENSIKAPELNQKSKEAIVDRKLNQAGVSKEERAKLGGDLSKLDIEVTPGAKTEVVVGASGTPELRVKKGATAGELRQAIKDAGNKIKPDTSIASSTFKPLDAPLPGSPADTVGKKVNSRLSGRAKAAHGEVRVEIAPEGEFGPSKTRADLRFEDGKPVLRFEGEPGPSVLAEEIAHLEQLADPKFADQRAKLEAASKSKWSNVADADKVAAHRAKLELEADAQKRAIDDLNNQLDGAKNLAADDPRVAAIDAAYQSLEQIRGKLEETHALTAEVEARGTLTDRPDFIDSRPDLTYKRPTNKRPNPDGWKTMTQKEFVKAYREMYPDTSLTDKELRDRHRNGQRLNPDSGHLKDPTLVDNPTPDITAKLKSEEEIDVTKLKIGKKDQEHIDGLLKERDKARKARDTARDAGDEVTAGQQGAKVNEASRQLGEAHAEAYMRENFPDFERTYPTDPDKPSRSGDFDQVWVKYAKGKGGTQVAVEVIIIEAKGGTSPLGARKTEGGVIAQQGTGAYYDSIAAVMGKGTPEMQRVADILSTIDPNKVSYKVVRTPIEMISGAKPKSVVVKVEVGDFDMASTKKKK